MAENAVPVIQQQTKPIKVKKWKVRQGSTVPLGRIILIYEFTDAEKPEQRKFKATGAGIIHKILATEGKVVQPGEVLYEIKACSHPTIMNDMCAECGADLRKGEAPKSSASVPMIHSIPDLKVSEEQAKKLGQADSDRLLKDRKLVLLVDLDQTLIHTTNDKIPPNIKDVYHFQLNGPKSTWYHTRFRPRTHNFLEVICEFYELHICTFGARNYAHMIAKFLDPDQRFFSNRILSRDECFDSTSKKANLKALFPCGDDMVCIIDDREDVWSHASNLIHVKPYHFFQHTGDINAPPGLDKHESDNKEGVDLNKLVKQSFVQKTTKNSDALKSESKSDNKITEKISEVNDTKKNGSSTDKKEEVSEESLEKKDNQKDSDNQKESSLIKKEETEPSSVVKEVTVENEIKKENEDNTSKLQESVVENESNGKLKAIPPLETAIKPEDQLIEIDDPDDYLLYLQDILKRIHKYYYELYDKMESGKIPDLKKVIPYVKSRVLKGCKLVFSGLVPTHCKLENSKAFQIAQSLGAEVQIDLDDDTTHLVALRPGTAKVNAGRKKKNLKMVTPDWLWSCAERWEHVEESIFPLNAKGSKNRHPPPHCSSPEHAPNYPEHETPALRKRTPSGRFMDTINPLMSFSSDDIADMDKEVEDILDNDTDESEEAVVKADTEQAEVEEDTDVEEVNFKHMVQTEILNNYDLQQDDGEREPTKNSSESDNDQDGVKPEKTKKPRRKRRLEEDENSQEDLPSRKFRRGEDIEELDMEKDPDDNDSDSFEAPDEEDDGEWNMMGAALEREFLSD